MLFKDIGKNEQMVHREFQRLADNITVAEAVALLMR